MSHSVTQPVRPFAPVQWGLRLLDVIALSSLLIGVTTFGYGRARLKALAENRYARPPAGVTWVSRAEAHDKQTRFGAGLSGAGLILSVGAAMKHASARRRTV